MRVATAIILIFLYFSLAYDVITGILVTWHIHFFYYYYLSPPTPVMSQCTSSSSNPYIPVSRSFQRRNPPAAKKASSQDAHSVSFQSTQDILILLDWICVGYFSSRALYVTLYDLLRDLETLGFIYMLKRTNMLIFQSIIAWTIAHLVSLFLDLVTESLSTEDGSAKNHGSFVRWFIADTVSLAAYVVCRYETTAGKNTRMISVQSIVFTSGLLGVRWVSRRY